MNDQAATTAQTDARTPSLAASLFVVGVMVGLILFSVIQFGSEVADGPLQVSMTLAALGVGLAGALLSTAQGTPTSVYTGVAILPLVPGLTLYQGMLAISQGKTAVAFERLFEAVVISVAIAVGVAVGLALGRNGVKLGRRIVGWRP